MTMTKSESNKKYYQAHTQKILEYFTKKVMCDVCQQEYARGHIPRHNKTAKHLKNASK